MVKYLLLFLLIVFAFPGSDWELKKDKSGIQVYTRSVEGSSFNEFRAVTIIKENTLIDVLNIILDVENYPTLFPDCINPRILKKVGDYYDIHYIQTKGPLTLKDRDSVFEQKTVIEKDHKSANVTLIPLPDYMPEVKDIVRVRNGSGFWQLEEDESKNVKVIYQFHGEPGGDIPAWLANSFVVSHPFKTIENLRNRLKTK